MSAQWATKHRHRHRFRNRIMGYTLDQQNVGIHFNPLNITIVRLQASRNNHTLGHLSDL